MPGAGRGELGQALRAARERAGLSQERAAERIGVSTRTLRNWEKGSTEPRWPAFWRPRLAQAYGVTEAELSEAEAAAAADAAGAAA